MERRPLSKSSDPSVLTPCGRFITRRFCLFLFRFLLVRASFRNPLSQLLSKSFKIDRPPRRTRFVLPYAYVLRNAAPEAHVHPLLPSSFKKGGPGRRWDTDATPGFVSVPTNPLVPPPP